MNLIALHRQFTAELLKARKRNLFLGVLGLLLFFGVLPVPIAIAGSANDNMRDWARSLVTFPGCLFNTIKIANISLPLLITVVAAGAVGSEYSGGTWKMTLPRTTSRASSLVAKFLATLVLTLGAVAFTYVFAIVMGAGGSLALGLNFVPGPVNLGAGDIGRMVAYYTLEFGCTISLTMLASVATRSFVGGTLLGFTAQHLLRGAVFLPGGWVSPMANLDSLQTRWLALSAYDKQDVENVLGHDMTWQASTVSVVAFSLAFMLLTMWLFEKRDLASE
ncbi:ABC transporter permease subunit [Pyxidicoccus parkwayensis]|uniref:ABC transporter permease subunit n=1 Tax=Pyxidicoccus parkwayensis TaxID=2813578 RepID=A0ABX7P6A7_9BACT|nr:ABC transporter permease subunit [Pyxidicoccus parkwaysis]QSQ25994.1 ABC transporter permease subunit [Pyxidicoccus parkwaysis]